MELWSAGVLEINRHQFNTPVIHYSIFMPPVLAYHLVDRRLDAGIAWMPPRRFERQIAWLAEAGYRSLSLSEYLQGGNLTKRVVITFDDGYRSLVQYALPILSRYHFRATVFVIAGYVGRPNLWDVKFFLPRFHHLDWSELRTLLAAGWEIGSHLSITIISPPFPTWNCATIFPCPEKF
jgi:hypothetical protein